MPPSPTKTQTSTQSPPYPKAAALLSNGNKYLAHVLVKGVKSNFTQLSNWLQEMYANSKKILSFFEQDEQNISIYFSSIKPSVLSKEEGTQLFNKTKTSRSGACACFRSWPSSWPTWSCSPRPTTGS